MIILLIARNLYPYISLTLTSKVSKFIQTWMYLKTKLEAFLYTINTFLKNWSTYLSSFPILPSSIGSYFLCCNKCIEVDKKSMYSGEYSEHGPI